MKKLILIAAALMLTASAGFAENQIANMAGRTPINENASAPAIPQPINTDIRKVRNYPEQPPVIPHKIDGYQIDLNANKCLTCHSRTAIEVSQAPMISVTHFMDREGQFLATVSPRRYFCTQCHVPQTDGRPPIENTFVDVDSVLDYLQKTDEGSK